MNGNNPQNLSSRQTPADETGEVPVVTGSGHPGELRPLSIREVRPLGPRPTYEMTMRAPWHNYLAEGVLTSNSHAVAYGQLAYRMAWLKAHHPAAFWAATLNRELGCPAQMGRYLAAARRQGIRILPPDINISGGGFAPVGDAIRCGLEVVRGISPAAVETLVKLRQGSGFVSLPDLVSRLPASLATASVLENLVRVGALDGFEGDRAQKLAAAGLWVKWRGSPQEAFPSLPSCPAWTTGRRLWEERLAAGVWLTGHPLDGWDDCLSRLGCLLPAAVRQVGAGQDFRLAGVVGEVRDRALRSGDHGRGNVAMVSLECPGETVPVYFPEAAWGKVKGTMVPGQVIIVEGTVTGVKSGASRLMGQRVWTLASALARLPFVTVVADAAGLAAVEKALPELVKERAAGTKVVHLHLAQRLENGEVVPHVNGTGGMDGPPRLVPEEAVRQVVSVVPDLEVQWDGLSTGEGATGTSLVAVWPAPVRSPGLPPLPSR